VTAPSGRILLVEAMPTQAEAARRTRGSGATRSASLAEACARLPDAIPSGTGPPDGAGLPVLRTPRQEGCEPAIIVIAAHAAMNTAVAVMRSGHHRPARSASQRQDRPHAAECDGDAGAGDRDARARDRHEAGARNRFTGVSPAIRAACRTVGSVAKARASILATGESGTAPASR